jgi:hypothetical protein
MKNIFKGKKAKSFTITLGIFVFLYLFTTSVVDAKDKFAQFDEWIDYYETHARGGQSILSSDEVLALIPSSIVQEVNGLVTINNMTADVVNVSLLKTGNLSFGNVGDQFRDSGIYWRDQLFMGMDWNGWSWDYRIYSPIVTNSISAGAISTTNLVSYGNGFIYDNFTVGGRARIVDLVVGGPEVVVEGDGWCSEGEDCNLDCDGYYGTADCPSTLCAHVMGSPTCVTDSTGLPPYPLGSGEITFYQTPLMKSSLDVEKDLTVNESGIFGGNITFGNEQSVEEMVGIFFKTNPVITYDDGLGGAGYSIAQDLNVMDLDFNHNDAYDIRNLFANTSYINYDLSAFGTTNLYELIIGTPSSVVNGDGYCSEGELCSNAPIDCMGYVTDDCSAGQECEYGECVTCGTEDGLPYVPLGGDNNITFYQNLVSQDGVNVSAEYFKGSGEFLTGVVKEDDNITASAVNMTGSNDCAYFGPNVTMCWNTTHWTLGFGGS